MISRFTKHFLLVFLVLVCPHRLSNPPHSNLLDLTSAAAKLLVASVTLYHRPISSHLDLSTGALFGDGGVEKEYHALPIQIHDRPPAISHAKGGVIMSKLGNETVKAALGRATWKLLHTVAIRYPEHPTDDEREALKAYFYLTSRLYPCGECAEEFQQLLELYPPQTSSRLSASAWLCFIHNKVNERLEKPIFDCAHLDDEYDCGCGDDGHTHTSTSSTTKDELTGADLIKGGR